MDASRPPCQHGPERLWSGPDGPAETGAPEMLPKKPSTRLERQPLLAARLRLRTRNSLSRRGATRSLRCSATIMASEAAKSTFRQEKSRPPQEAQYAGIARISFRAAVVQTSLTNLSESASTRGENSGWSRMASTIKNLTRIVMIDFPISNDEFAVGTMPSAGVGPGANK
jgi:hypothetical protein